MTTTTTPGVKKFDARVIEQYERVERGDKPARIGDDMGITGSTVSANVKRVRQAIADGYTVTADDGSTVTGDTAVPAVDPHAIAEAMVPGSSLVTHALLKLDDERAAMLKRADDIVARANEQATTLRASADNARVTEQPRIDAVASALGFDTDAWREAVDTAEREHAAAQPQPTPDASPVKPA